MATIKDVAKEAGVSIGTVSAVLNGHTNIRVENVEKVNKAIVKLNYQPNLVARTLKTGASGSIGLLIPDITNPFYPELARGVEDAAGGAGLTVFLCNDDRNGEKEREYISALLSKNVDGIIIAKPQLSAEELHRLERMCSLVLVDPSSELLGRFDAVNARDKEGVAKAMDRLFALGHSRIAYISGLMESSSAFDRFHAYKSALAAREIPYREGYVKYMRYDWSSGYTAAKELMALSSPPTAIVAANDVIAMGALKALRELGVSVPADVSVVGFDDIDQASYSIPPLTTVRQPKYEMGIASVELLLQRMACREREIPPVTKTFETELILRDTAADAASARSQNET